MGMYRNITTEFWTDTRVEMSSCEEKLLLLYIYTSPYTNLSGCYEISYKRMSNDTGLSMQQVSDAMDGLKASGLVGYCAETSEVYIPSWDRYNWTKSPKLRKPLAKSIGEIKSEEFRQLLQAKFDSISGNEQNTSSDTVSEKSDTVPIPPVLYCSVSDTVLKDKQEEKEERKSSVKEVVAYLNAATGASYKATTKKTAQLVSARMREGFDVDDFKAVIDKKSSDWKCDPKMSRYLRPETLFGTKFEGYLQEAKAVRAHADRYAKYDR